MAAFFCLFYTIELTVPFIAWPSCGDDGSKEERTMRVFRWRAWWLVTVLSVFVSAGCGSPHHAPAVDPGASGALFGAYVSPDETTDEGRVRASAEPSRATRAPLGVIQTYHKWTAAFPTEIDRYVSERGRVLLLSWAGDSPTEILDGATTT